MARRTWRYFDDLVNAAMNWLPPDNSQLALHVEVAQRTSPTNIGLWLTSALAARISAISRSTISAPLHANHGHTESPGAVRRASAQLVQHADASIP